MEIDQLIKRFFDYRIVICEGMEVNNSLMLSSNGFFPILMLLVKQSVNQTMLEEEIVSFNIRKKKESLCYLAIDSLDFNSINAAANIIEELIQYSLIPGIFLNDKHEVVISDLVLNCRKTLKEIPEGAFFSCNALCKLLFGEEFPLKLSEEFIQTQVEVLSYCE